MFKVGDTVRLVDGSKDGRSGAGKYWWEECHLTEGSVHVIEEVSSECVKLVGRRYFIRSACFALEEERELPKVPHYSIRRHKKSVSIYYEGCTYPIKVASGGTWAMQNGARNLPFIVLAEALLALHEMGLDDGRL